MANIDYSYRVHMANLTEEKISQVERLHRAFQLFCDYLFRLAFQNYCAVRSKKPGAYYRPRLKPPTINMFSGYVATYGIAHPKLFDIIIARMNLEESN